MYLNENNSKYWDDFQRWASNHLGQAYSLIVEDGLIVDRTTAWAFAGYVAGRNNMGVSEEITTETLKDLSSYFQ